MSGILHIETSTQVCSVAVSSDGACVYHNSTDDGPSHATLLAPFVQEALDFADHHAIPLHAVAVSCGPGSYTGLRIGVSMAKGVCYGRGLALLAIPTLELLCVPLLLQDSLPPEALLCPMLDARRLEVYDALYDRALNTIRPTTADIIDEHSFASELAAQPIYFLGNGAEKCKPYIKHPNAVFVDNIQPLARYMFPLAEKQLAQGMTQDVAYFEPFYLKEFVTTTPKKNKYGL